MPKGVYERKTEQQRFWEKVDIKGEDDCWMWLGSKDPDEYGWFSFTCVQGKKKTVMAHRYSLMLKLNDFNLPEEQFACHNCDKKYPRGDNTNRGCVNPNHLYAAPAGENSRRMAELNRGLCGEHNHQTTLTNVQAQAILDEYTADKQNGRLYGSLERLAKKYSQKKQCIYKLVSGKTWKELNRSGQT